MRYSFALTCAVFALFLTPAMAEDRPTVNSESVKAVDNHPVSKKGAGAELLVFGISKQFLTEVGQRRQRQRVSHAEVQGNREDPTTWLALVIAAGLVGTETDGFGTPLTS